VHSAAEPFIFTTVLNLSNINFTYSLIVHPDSLNYLILYDDHNCHLPVSAVLNSVLTSLSSSYVDLLYSVCSFAAAAVGAAFCCRLMILVYFRKSALIDFLQVVSHLIIFLGSEVCDTRVSSLITLFLTVYAALFLIKVDRNLTSI